MRCKPVSAGNREGVTKGAMVLAALILTVSMAVAVEGPSRGLGKRLFESTELGSNGKSCATCHQGGKGLQNSASYDADELGEIINRCIEGALVGDGLEPDSNDLKSLVIYIKSFASGGKEE